MQLHEQGDALINLGRERMAVVADATCTALEPGFDLRAWMITQIPGAAEGLDLLVFDRKGLLKKIFESAP